VLAIAAVTEFWSLLVLISDSKVMSSPTETVLVTSPVGVTVRVGNILGSGEGTGVVGTGDGTGVGT